MEAGGPLDLVSLDACNTCSPIPVRDDSGIARFYGGVLECTVVLLL